MDFTDLIDLAAERVGGAALLANDEFFAPKENLLKASAPEWREGAYTERGKWMDGWETRRRRAPGYDWCIVRLGIPGVVRGVVVDTSYFRGNYPESCSVDAAAIDGVPELTQLIDDTLGPAWVQIVPRSPLQGDTRNLFPVQHDARVTHLRLNIFPDGGVARLRVYGEGRLDRRMLDAGSEIDLAAAEQGGLVLVCSDMFFGHRHNLIMPGRSTHMGDGWETKRRRSEGHDWTIVRLASRGTLHRVEIDTDHFKGNAPASCMLETCDVEGASVDSLVEPAREWRVLLPQTPLQPHARHRFVELAHWAPATHARLSIYPDGGIARLRLFGRLEQGVGSGVSGVASPSATDQ
jgi:allantoicase